MLTSLALIFLVGLAMSAICKQIRLPGIIGMLATGIVLGPYVLDLLSPSILGISADLRKLALIIILLKAGLSLNLSDLKKVGRPAILMSFVPASFEICGYILFAPMILGVTRVEAAVMGAVMGAVSPAVVPTDDTGGGIVRRYLRDRVIYNIFADGTGRTCKCEGFYQYPDLNRVRNRTRLYRRLSAVPVLRACV